MRELPAGWARCSLGDVVEECIGRNSEDLGSASVFGVFKGQGLRPMKDRVRAENLDRYKRVERSWFAFNPMRINIGSIARHHGTAPVLVSPDYVVFRCREERIAPDFLDQVREGTEWTRFVENSGQGGVRVRIYFDALAKLPLLLPPLVEQRKIAAILSSVDETIEKTEAVIAQLDVVKKAMLEELLTRGIPGRHSRFKQTEIGELPEEWSIVPMESVSIQPGGMVGGPFGSDLTASDYVDIPGVPVIRGSDVAPGRFQEHGLAYVSTKKAGDLRKNAARRGDLIMTQRGASLGEATLIPESSRYEDYIVSQTMMRMSPDRSKVLPRFLLHWVCSQPAQAWLQRRAVGNAQPHLNLTIFRAMPAIVPPLPEQQRIADIVDAVDAAIASSRREHAAQKTVKTALGSVLLAGELRATPSEGRA